MTTFKINLIHSDRENVKDTITNKIYDRVIFPLEFGMLIIVMAVGYLICR